MKRRTLIAFVSVSLLATAIQAQYSTGFEGPDFVSGTINGQSSWTSTSPNNARVLTSAEIAAELTGIGLIPGTTVHGGSQALMVGGAGSSSASIRQVSGLELTPGLVLDIWTRPLAAGTTTAPTGNVFFALEDSSGNRAAAVRFGPSTSIDYGTTVTGIWQASGTTWDSDSWYRFTLTLDYASKTYDFAINGTQVNTSPIEFYNSASAQFNQLRIFRGSNQAGMIVDDLSIVAIPEPGTVSLLLLGAGVGWGYRRRR